MSSLNLVLNTVWKSMAPVKISQQATPTRNFNANNQRINKIAATLRLRTSL